MPPFLRFLARRLLAMVAVLLGVVTLTFFVNRLAPGGPFDRDRKVPPAIEAALLQRYHLDDPLWKQYGAYLRDIAHGDLGISFKYRDRSVREILAQTLPVSFTLGAVAFLVAAVTGVWVGVVAATRPGSAADLAVRLLALGAISVPTFVTGPAAVLLFALTLGLFPVGGWGRPEHIVLPALVLAAPYVAYVARLMRGSLLEVLGQDFIRTARAKGLSERRVVYGHALKVAILPVVSFLGPLAANLLTGSLIVEYVFQIPGMGGFFVNSVLNSDYFLLGGVVIVYCALLVGMNLLVDVAYTLLDPRVKLG